MKHFRFTMEHYQQLWGEEPHDFKTVTVEISEFTIKGFASKCYIHPGPYQGHIDVKTVEMDLSDFKEEIKEGKSESTRFYRQDTE